MLVFDIMSVNKSNCNLGFLCLQGLTNNKDKSSESNQARRAYLAIPPLGVCIYRRHRCAAFRINVASL